jgi:hypothetical protein
MAVKFTLPLLKTNIEMTKKKENPISIKNELLNSLIAEIVTAIDEKKKVIVITFIETNSVVKSNLSCQNMSRGEIVGLMEGLKYDILKARNLINEPHQT